jgi:hypothetical protein
MLMKKYLAALLWGATLTAPSVADAATSAYWRHEEGAAGGLIAAGPDSVLDSSGNGHHMRTFDPAFTSATYTSTVAPLALRSGLPNTLALDFGPGGDDGGLNDDNYSDGKSINSQVFGELTVELAFKMDTVAGYQAVFGKDGKPIATSPVPPFKVLIRGDSFPGPLDTPRPGTGAPNQLFVEWIDGDGDTHYLAGGQTITTIDWNHIAVTISDTDAKLYVARGTGGYALLDSITGADFAGASGEVLIVDPTNWTAGRGMFNGGITDWSDAHIDEIRISDTALAPNQFLFVPEPATAALAAGALALGFLRRRRALA